MSKLISVSLWDKIRTRVLPLPIAKQKAVAAVIGACVADAASRPFHWLYDQAKLEATVGEHDPAFWPHSVSPYYTIPTGDNSCYNDLGYVMLQTISLHTSSQLDPNSLFDQGRFEGFMREMFGPGTPYREAYERRIEMYDPARRYDAREPVIGPWQQKAVTEYLRILESHSSEDLCGNPDSLETDGLVTTLPLIAVLSAEQIDPAVIQQQTARAAKLLSSNPFAMRHTLSAAMILNAIINSGEEALSFENFRQAISSVSMDSSTVGDTDTKSPGLAHKVRDEVDTMVVEEELEIIHEAISASEPHTVCVHRWGRPCANPGSFMGAMHAVLTAGSTTGDRDMCGFADSVRKVILAGGCNCSRANLVGACLGAAYGFQGPEGEEGSGSSESGSELTGRGLDPRGIPLAWMEKTNKIHQVLELILLVFERGEEEKVKGTSDL